jgi:GWxTD domain-containing protein
VAELSYELGKVLENEWLPWRDLGSLPTSALEEVGCSMPGTGDVDDLIALNYLCPQEMDRVLRGAFEVAEPTHPYRDEVLAAYAGAVEAHPGHVAANVELLLDMADDEWWFEMFTEARRFAWASHGHPYALLMSGLALHRMGRSEEAAEDFAVAFQGLPPEEVEEIEDLTPLVGRAAARSFRDMDEEEGRIAVLEFWRTLDPILITDVNEREVEHYARGAYAHLRFGGAGTDAGQVWARYGRPNAVRSLGEGDGLRTEFWAYGLGPDLTFRRPAASRDLSLTSEGRAYLTDLRQVFPHRYGTRSRSVFTLPAQLARFREGPESGGARLDIHTEVPEILSTGEADSLLVGLFLLDADGQRLAEERRSLSAEASPVRLLDVGVDGAEAMVLEFYNPRAARVAVVRSPVRRDGEEGEDSRISDLLLVDPAAPDSREISRTDSWVVPRTTANDASGDEVGLLFELYDVPASQDRYRMRVRLEPAEGGAVRTLPSRPSGETHFGEEWSRKPIPGPRSAEYVTLDFSDVPPGGYVLRLRVEFFGGYEPIEVARPIQRR